MKKRKNSLYRSVVKLGKAIDRLDVNDPDSVALVQRRYRALRRVTGVVVQATGDLAAVVGFDCSPPGSVEL